MADVALVAANVVRADGQGRVMLEVARQLARHGHAVTVHAHSLDPELEGLVRWNRIPRPRGPQAAADVALWRLAGRAVAAARPDATCVMGAATNPSPPFVYYAEFSHVGWAEAREKADLTQRWHQRLYGVAHERLERRVVRRADLVLACSRRTLGELPVLPGQRAEVIPNGVDVEEFRTAADPERRRAARRRLGLPDAAAVVGFVGEYRTGRKGLEPLIRAVGRGEEHLVVAGDGAASVAGSWAASAGAGGRVHLLGFVDVRDVLAVADVVAVPSLYEPFSLVATEAAAAGLPVLASAAVGAVAHLEGAAVVVEDPLDVGQLRAALDRLRDPLTRERLGAAGRRCCEDLRWELTAGAAASAIAGVAERARG